MINYINNMNYAGTTEISSLPLSPQVPQQDIPQTNTDNIKIQTYSQEPPLDPQNNQGVQQQSYNQLVSDIQQASVSGALNLPSRDIPQSTNEIMQDQEIKPNFVPQQSNIDYIANHETAQDMIRNNRNEQNNIDTLDGLYQEFQIPILISILYFMYQLPAVRVYLHRVIPSLFNSDGNPNLYGYVFNSVFFGVMYYFMIRLIKQFTEM